MGRAVGHTWAHLSIGVSAIEHSMADTPCIWTEQRSSRQEGDIIKCLLGTQPPCWVSLSLRPDKLKALPRMMMRVVWAKPPHNLHPGKARLELSLGIPIGTGERAHKLLHLCLPPALHLAYLGACWTCHRTALPQLQPGSSGRVQV